MNQGQVSARLPHASRFYIKNAASRIHEANPTPSPLNRSTNTRSLATGRHPNCPCSAIYGASEQVNASSNSHAPYTLLMGAVDMDIRALSHEGAWLLGDIAASHKRAIPSCRSTSPPRWSEGDGSGRVVLLRIMAASSWQKHCASAVCASARARASLHVAADRCRTGLTFASSSPAISRPTRIHLQRHVESAPTGTI